MVAKKQKDFWDTYTKHRITSIVLAITILVFFVLMFSPFVVPMLMAVLFAFALEPILNKYTTKTSKRRLPTAIILISLFLLVSLPIVFVLWRVVAKVNEYYVMGFENTPLYQTLKRAIDYLTVQISSIAEKVHLNGGVDISPDAMLAKVGPVIVGFTSKIATQLPDFLLSFLVFCAMLYFLLSESKTIKKQIIALNLLTTSEINKIIIAVQKSSYNALVVTTMVGAIQSLCVAIAATICGYREFLIIFLLTFFFSFIPVIGAAPMAALLSIFSFIQGEIPAGIGLLVAAGLAGTIDNIIKPYLLNSSEDELNPILALLAIIGAVLFYGIPGLLLGPILIQLAIKIVPILLTAPKEESV